MQYSDTAAYVCYLIGVPETIEPSQTIASPHDSRRVSRVFLCAVEEECYRDDRTNLWSSLGLGRVRRLVGGVGTEERADTVCSSLRRSALIFS